MVLYPCFCSTVNKCVCYVLMASNPKCNVLNWNVHRLNNPARQKVVRDLVVDHHSTIVRFTIRKMIYRNT
jgi:hypothetical protein